VNTQWLISALAINRNASVNYNVTSAFDVYVKLY